MGPWFINHVLAAVAAVLFVLASLCAHGTINWNSLVIGFLGLAFLAAAFLPWRGSTRP